MDSIDQRTRKALDDVVKILNEMKLDTQKRLPIEGLLDDTGHICERKGYEPARVFVVGKKGDTAYENKHDDVNRLINIINALEQHRLPLTEASYILKKLNAIKQFYVAVP